MPQLFNPKFGSVVAIGPFYVANLDTALTNTDLLCGQTGQTLEIMPAAGSVVGLAVTPSAQPSAGTAVFSIHSSGTELVNGPTATVNSTGNSAGTYGTANSAREHTFAAGAKLGISATTSTNLAATTVDYNVTLYVRFDPD